MNLSRFAASACAAFVLVSGSAWAGPAKTAGGGASPVGHNHAHGKARHGKHHHGKHHHAMHNQKHGGHRHHAG
jgi:hypothetical protein